MHEATETFLVAMRDRVATNALIGREVVPQAVEICTAAVAEAITLGSMFRKAEHRETDASVLSVMGEYGQKLGALRKIGEEMETKALRFERILNELDELERRVGDDLRASMKNEG